MTRALIIAALLAACGSKGSKPASKDAGVVVAAKDAAVPDARPDEPEYLGDPFEDGKLPAGTLRVTLTRGETKGPAAGVPLHLVSLVASGVGKVDTFTTDASGAFEAPGLSRDGTIAYHVLGELDGDRLESGPIILRDQGVRVELRARAPGDALAPFTGIPELDEPIPPGEAWVSIAGTGDMTDLTLVDVATSASKTATEVGQRSLGPIARFTGLTPGAIYVAHLRHVNGLFVSRPLLAMGGVGAGRTLMAMLAPMVRCNTNLRRDRDGLHGWMRCDVWQTGGVPRALASTMKLPLPETATKIQLHDPDGPAKLDAGALTWTGVVPPGMTVVDVEYTLALNRGQADVAIVSPQAMQQLGFMIEVGTTIEVRDVTGGRYMAPDFSESDARHMVWADYTKAGDRMTFSITGAHPPTPCELLDVAPWTADGNPAPAPDVVAEAADGTQVRLSSLRGKPVVLNLFASWTPPSAQEMPSLIALSRVIEPLGAELVVVASDQEWTDVQKLIDPSSGINVWLDRPKGGEYVLGEAAHAFGTTKLPETYLIDAEGLVRHWVVNSRDWTSPDALACIQSLKTPWTGPTSSPPPAYVKATSHLSGTIRLGNVTVPRGGVLFISARNDVNGPTLAAIRIEGPTFPQSFAMTDAEMFSPDHPLQGEVEVTARVDADGDIATRTPGDVFGEVKAPAGSANVNITIDQIVP